MSRPILQIYAAAVCFASLSCLALAVGFCAYSTVALISPSFTLHPMNIPLYEPQPTLLPSNATEGPRMFSPSNLSEAELLKRRNAAQESAVENELATARQSLLRWGIAAVISSLLFYAHWQILRRKNGNAV